MPGTVYLNRFLTYNRLGEATMNTTIKNKERLVRRLCHLGKRVLLALGLILLLLLCLHLRLILSTIKFFHMMERIPSWTEVTNANTIETYPLDDMKQVACWLLEQPDRSRRRIIAAYQMYIEICSWKAGAFDDLPPASKIFVLLRLLFDVPEDYPRDAARFFGSWRGSLAHEDRSATVDLLWPLGYQDHQLVLKGTYFTYFGFPYDGLSEYDYFAVRFPFRSTDDLE